MESGVPVVALKDQLVKLHKACLDVVKDADLDPTADVQRDIVNIARSIPAPSIPRPFRPIDMSAFTSR
jgi:hypothetical protein